MIICLADRIKIQMSPQDGGDDPAALCEHRKGGLKPSKEGAAETRAKTLILTLLRSVDNGEAFP